MNPPLRTFCPLPRSDSADAAHYVLCIEIDGHPARQADLLSRLDDYLSYLQGMHQQHPGYLACEVDSDQNGRVFGRIHWRRREDWEAAWDCQQARGEVFADGLLRLGARSIRFDAATLSDAPARL
ncbi:MAG: hypothetical protein GAK45_01742 [Pseudomonas citronellolis]|nr:MAG: hypothetical protein GAK45_01742 [Pseudomonas citronellolis]